MLTGNVESYLEQLYPILDFNTPERLEIKYNSEWLDKLNFHKVQELDIKFYLFK